MEEPEHTGVGPEATDNENETREALRAQVPRIYVASLSDYNAGRLHGARFEQRPALVVGVDRTGRDQLPVPGRPSPRRARPRHARPSG